MKIFIQTEVMMIGGNRYKAIVEDEGKEYNFVSRLSLRNLFQNIASSFGDKLEEVYTAEINGELEGELEGDDLIVWDTPLRYIIDEERL
jgi:hypothetical protein